MTTFQPHEIVNVTIKGARIMPPKPGHDHILTLGYEQTQPGVFATIEITHPAARTVEITRVAPAEWPPRPGDLWGDVQNGVWFAYDNTDLDNDAPGTDMRLCSTSTHSYGRAERPDTVSRRYGPLTLVYREAAK